MNGTFRRTLSRAIAMLSACCCRLWLTASRKRLIVYRWIIWTPTRSVPSSLTWKRTAVALFVLETRGLPPFTLWFGSLASGARNIFSGAARSGQCHSSERASRRYRISKSLSWTLCSPPRTSVRNRGVGITLFCYSFITPAQEQARLHWSPLGISKRSPTDRAWSNYLGREISEGLVLSGRVRCRNFFL